MRFILDPGLATNSTVAVVLEKHSTSVLIIFTEKCTIGTQVLS